MVGAHLAKKWRLEGVSRLWLGKALMSIGAGSPGLIVDFQVAALGDASAFGVVDFHAHPFECPGVGELLDFEDFEFFDETILFVEGIDAHEGVGALIDPEENGAVVGRTVAGFHADFPNIAGAQEITALEGRVVPVKEFHGEIFEGDSAVVERFVTTGGIDLLRAIAGDVGDPGLGRAEAEEVSAGGEAEVVAHGVALPGELEGVGIASDAEVALQGDFLVGLLEADLFEDGFGILGEEGVGDGRKEKDAEQADKESTEKRHWEQFLRLSHGLTDFRVREACRANVPWIPHYSN